MFWWRSNVGLIKLGYRLLEHEPLKALRVGQELRRRRNSGGFEIEARALWEMGKRGRAIAVLEDGVRAFPTIFILWSYLGHYLSDEGRYDEALHAFERARSLPKADMAVEDLNIAIVYFRQGRYEESLALAHRVPVPPKGPPAWRVADVKVSALNGLGRHEEALRVAAGGRDSVMKGTPGAVGAVSRLTAEMARALWLGRGDSEGALAAAWAAIAARKQEETAAHVIRDVRNERSAAARAWRLTLVGVWPWRMPRVKRRSEFLTVYNVVANDVEEAMELVRPFEPPEVRETLRVQEAEDQGPRPDASKGVYWTSEYVFSVKRKLDLSRTNRGPGEG